AICLRCFASFADERLVPWDDDIQFFPKSLRRQMDVQERSMHEQLTEVLKTELGKGAAND
ncbi:hypothetical protein LCGC14_3023440, partial [marine sediment metagenome]